MRKRRDGGIAAILFLGLMCAVLPGCGGGGGGGGGGNGTQPGLMGGSWQGTALPLVDNAVTTFSGSLTGQSGSRDNVIATNARFNLPIGITTDGTNLYVADSNNNTIRKVDAGGAVTTIAGDASAAADFIDGTGKNARFNAPVGITIKTDGQVLFVADSVNNSIRQVVIATGQVTTLAGTGSPGSQDGNGAIAEFSSPGGITADDTYLYVADSGNNTIRRVLIATGFVDTIAGSATDPPDYVSNSNGLVARFNLPQGITTDGSSLFVADTVNHAIRRIRIGGTWQVSTLAGSGPLSPGSRDGQGLNVEFFFPYGITSDGTNLYVADSNNNTIRKVVASTGVVTTVAGSASDPPDYVNAILGKDARFNLPEGVTTDGTKLYVTDSLNNVIRAIQ